MKFIETEANGIRKAAETEGTGIINQVHIRNTDSKNLNLAETEGTGIRNKSFGRLMMLGLIMCLVSPLSFSGELRLYSEDNEYVKGVYSEHDKVIFVEGLMTGNTIELIGQSSLLNEREASDEGTGGKEASDEGTGKYTASDEGTGRSVASDEGTGGSPASDEGTGGSPASDEGTGGAPASDEGTGFAINDNGVIQSINILLNYDCSEELAFGSASNADFNEELFAVQVYLNGQTMACENEGNLQ